MAEPERRVTNRGRTSRVPLIVTIFACCLAQQVSVVAVAQEGRPRVANVGSGPSGTTSSGIAGGAWSPALTGERRPQYRLHKSDVIDINFSFSPEFNQTVTVQPDGFLSLRGAPGVYGEGQTLLELQSAIRAAYSPILQEPEVTVVLKDFDKPYFVTSGEVTRPGKYELRGDTTVAEAVAMAGGFTRQAKHSQVVLFRHVSAELVEAHLVDVKRMLHSRNLAEDMHLQPGDFVFVPQSKISKIRQFLPASNLSMYINPTQF